MPIHSSEDKVRYKLLKFFGCSGYCIGTNGSVWTRWWKKGMTGSKKGGAVGFIGTKWRRLKSSKGSKGYRSVKLIRDDGKTIRETIHRLVLLAFVGPCPEGMCACHWDDNPSNNQLKNLRWGTAKDNKNDSKRNGRSNIGKHYNQGECCSKAKLNTASVLEIRHLWQLGQLSARELADRYQVDIGTIRSVVLYRTWKHI